MTEEEKLSMVDLKAMIGDLLIKRKIITDEIMELRKELNERFCPMCEHENEEKE